MQTLINNVMFNTSALETAYVSVWALISGYDV